MKKTVSILLCLLFLVPCFAVCASGAVIYTEESSVNFSCILGQDAGKMYHTLDTDLKNLVLDTKNVSNIEALGIGVSVSCTASSVTVTFDRNPVKSGTNVKGTIKFKQSDGKGGYTGSTHTLTITVSVTGGKSETASASVECTQYTTLDDIEFTIPTQIPNLAVESTSVTSLEALGIYPSIKSISGNVVTLNVKRTPKVAGTAKGTITLKQSDGKGGFIDNSLVITISAEVKPAEKILGDVDRDKALTIVDATCIQKWLAEIIGDDDLDLSVADVDKDGNITIMDATQIQRILAGMD